MYAFSRRLPHHSSLNKIALLTEQLKRHGALLSDLTESNPTSALADYPHAAISQSLGTISNLTYRPEPKGTFEARQTVARYYAARGVRVGPEQLLLTASTSEAYTHIFKLLCDPFQAVLTPSPSYPLFEHLAALCSIEIKPYRLLYDGGWHIDFEHLRSQICARTRAIVVVNPNNPTGHFLTGSELLALRRVSAEFQLPLISDEVFIDYSLEGRTEIPCCAALDQTSPSFVMNGLSKIAGMPQMKLAWILVSGPQELRCAALERLEIMADAYLSVNTPVQTALPALLELGDGIRHAIKQQINTNLDLLRYTLSGTAGNTLHVEGGWSAIVRLPAVLDEETWVLKLLRERQVMVQPGFFFDIPGGPHIVVSLLSRPEVFARGISAIRNAIMNEVDG